MFSKVKISLYFLYIIMFVTGCSWKPGSNLNWGEQNPPSNNVKANFDKYNCLAHIDQDYDDFINAKIQPEVISKTASCLREALIKFKLMTRDLPNGAYSPERLAEFLNKEYLKKQKIDNMFLHEIMQAKRVVLGGEDRVITAAEIDGLTALISLFEKQALLNLPFMSLYKSATEAGGSPIVSREKLLSAKKQLLSTAFVFADLFKSQNQYYSLDSLQRLIYKTKEFLNRSNYQHQTFTGEQLLDVMSAYKEISTGKKDLKLFPSEWHELFRSAAMLFSIYASYQVGIEGQNFQYGPTFEILVQTANESFDMIGQWIKLAPSRIISFESTDRLFDSLERAGLMPFKMTKASLSAVYQQFVNVGLRTLNEKRMPRFGFGESELQQLRNEFNLWADTQDEINKSIQRELNMNFVDNEIIPFSTVKRIATFDFTKIFSSQKQMLIKNIGGNDVRPLFRNGDPRAVIMPLNELAGFGVFNSVQNLSYMNTIRAFARLLIRSFASDTRALQMSGITEPEMINFYNTIKPLGTELKIMDPRGKNWGKNYFAEGNLFTFSGDGISAELNNQSELLTYNEVVEYIAEIWSGGKIRDQIYNELLIKCKADGYKFLHKDPFLQEKIDRNCFEKHVFDNQLSEFSNLPYMFNYFKKLDAAERQELLTGLQEIAKIGCEDERFIERSEIATLSTILHYVEVIFTVYDVDRNGVLDSFEIMKAFKRFYGYIDRVLRSPKAKADTPDSGYSVSTVKAIYLYLVEHRALPLFFGGASIYINKFWYFNNDLDQAYSSLPEVSLDRVGLVTVLSALAEVRKNSQPRSCEPVR